MSTDRAILFSIYYDFAPHTVIHFNWGCVDATSREGFRFRMEDVQADGRTDIVAEHPCGAYVFELKVDESAAAALEQVKAKGYDAPYRAKGLPLYAVGLSFDSKTRHLVDADACAL